MQIKRFFECLIPTTVCNLKCGYCYVIQRNCRNMKKANMKYSPEQIGKSLTKERLGGACFFSICGAGETLAQQEIIPVVKNLLNNGHYINITTNGTLTSQIKKIEDFGEENLKRLHFSFSFHYNELVKLNLLDVFFSNIQYVKKLGCSFIVQLNLCDEYLEHIEEIKNICIKNVGAMPQIAATRKESKGVKKVELHTNLSIDEYTRIGKSFDSKLFNYTMKNFNVKRKEFCYAGERSGTLDLSTGILKKCYCAPGGQDIFANPDKPIKFEAIGKNCPGVFCMNSSHFMSLGIIDNNDIDTYCTIRDRTEAGWFNDVMKEALDGKLSETNKVYSIFKKNAVNIKERIKKIVYKMLRIVKKVLYHGKK